MGKYNGYLLGDSAYPCKKYPMTPYNNPDTDAKMKFNRCIARSRVVIEQTLGILNRRFACFHRCLRLDPNKVVIACVILHKFGIIHGDIIPPIELLNDNEPIVHFQNIDSQDGVSTRRIITDRYFSGKFQN